MTLARDASLTIIERMEREPAFAKLMLDEAASVFLNGEPNLSRAILHMLVQATVSFQGLAELTSTPIDRLHDFLSMDGDPGMGMDLMASIFTAIGRHLGVTMQVRSVAAETRRAGLEAMTQTRPDAA
ncbi:transcriptional regulator [Rugamonas sp.]|uniref:transcriptional regulator n=1 Tax=Rugamonas sp. TaxID=1926287 RepID=UPI0025D6B681|nr:transcriptional regulator [Rugamonas sp.]